MKERGRLREGDLQREKREERNTEIEKGRGEIQREREQGDTTTNTSEKIIRSWFRLLQEKGTNLIFLCCFIR